MDREGLHALQAGPMLGTFLSVTAKGDHTCAIREQGHVLRCWGKNGNGRAASPAGAYSYAAAGGDFTCAIREPEGTVMCQGGFSTAPAGKFTSLTGGHGFACGIHDDRSPECWGSAAMASYNPGCPRVEPEEPEEPEAR